MLSHRVECNKKTRLIGRLFFRVFNFKYQLFTPVLVARITAELENHRAQHTTLNRLSPHPRATKKVSRGILETFFYRAFFVTDCRAVVNKKSSYNF